MGALTTIEGKAPGRLLFQPRTFTDSRGFFTETYHAERYREAGLDRTFVQDNLSFSHRHVLRGLHFQSKHPQGKIVFVVRGEIWDVAVDIRRGSPTFGHWEGHTVSGDNHHQLYIPEGFAHGFVVLSETAAVMYKCTDFYHPGDDRGLLWTDPRLGIEWPVERPHLSAKDAALPTLAEVDESILPTFSGGA